MKEFDKYIRDNRDKFDDKEPPVGHIDRFEALLDKEMGRSGIKEKRYRLITVLSIAASLTIVVLFGVHFFTTDIEDDRSDNNSFMVSNEFIQANEYYKSQMEERITEIMCKIDQADTETKIELQKDLSTILNENKSFIERIKQNNNQELAIFYLVQHYETNIEVLDFINEKLGKHLKC